MPCILKCDAFKKGLEPEAGEESDIEWTKKTIQHIVQVLFWFIWYWMNPKKRTWTRSWRRFWYWMNQKNYSTYCLSPFWVHWILNEPKKDLNPKLEKILILNELKKKNYSTYCSNPFWVHWILNEPKKDLKLKLEKILILDEPKKLNTLKTFFTCTMCWNRF